MVFYANSEDGGIRNLTKYKCGHESEIIVTDNSALTIAAYLEWNETVGREGTQEKCWTCWCKERNQRSASTQTTPKEAG